MMLEIRDSTAERLRARAREQGLAPDEYLDRLMGQEESAPQPVAQTVAHEPSLPPGFDLDAAIARSRARTAGILDGSIPAPPEVVARLRAFEEARRGIRDIFAGREMPPIPEGAFDRDIIYAD